MVGLPESPRSVRIHSNSLREGGEKPDRFFGESSTPKGFGAVTRGGQSLGRRERDSVGRPELRRSIVNLQRKRCSDRGKKGGESQRGKMNWDSLAGPINHREQRHWALPESSLGLEQSFGKTAEVRERDLYHWGRQHVHFILLFSIIYLKTVSLFQGYVLQSLSYLGFGSSTDGPQPLETSLAVPCLALPHLGKSGFQPWVWPPPHPPPVPLFFCLFVFSLDNSFLFVDALP